MYVTSYLASGTWHLAKVTLDIQIMSHLATGVICGPLFSPEKNKSILDISNKKYINQTSYPARALRALGLLLADGAPTVGGGKTF